MGVQPLLHEGEHFLPPKIDRDDVACFLAPHQLTHGRAKPFEIARSGLGRDSIVLARVYHERRRYEPRSRHGSLF